VVERSELAVERVGVLAAGLREEQVAPPGVGEDLDRVLLGVRVEVAHEVDRVLLTFGEAVRERQ
jgi:hypothetical protein